MSHDKFFGICENKCLVEINADSVGAAAQDLSNIDNEVFAEKATAAGVGGIGADVVPIENGGTGATTAEEARTNLGVASSDLSNVDNTVFLEKVSNVGVSGGTVLFSSESGTTDTTITLSDDISNYKYVEVYYKKVSYSYSVYQSDTFPEGFPDAPYLNESTIPECINMEKAIVGNDGTAHVYFYRENYIANIQYDNNSSGHLLAEVVKRQEIQTTASLTNNTFLHNSGTFMDARRYYYNNYYTKDGTSFIEKTIPTSAGFDSTPAWSYSKETKGPEIYAIVGYK